jgi:hypothetical protein
MAKRKFLGPKSYSLEKKKRLLKALGASVRMKNLKIQTSRDTRIFGAPSKWMFLFNISCFPTFPRRPLEIGLFYSMPTCLSSWDLSGIEDETPQKRALTPTYNWKKKILHTYLHT